MKNKIKAIRSIAGIIVLFAVIILSISACEEEKDSITGMNGVTGGGGSSVSVQSGSLTLSGKVFTQEWAMAGLNFKEFKGNLNIKNISAGSGSISNGTLNFTIGTPNQSDMKDINDEFDFSYYYDDVTITDTSVKCFAIYNLEINNSSDYDYLYLIKVALSGNMSSYKQTFENVTFVYLDKPVTITGSGRTETSSEGSTEINAPLNLSFTAGWNVICEKSEMESSGGKGLLKRSLLKITPNSSFTWSLGEKNY